MSFSFSYLARNKTAAKQRLAKEHAPESVKAFVGTAIDNIPNDGLIVVKANGHLCDGAGSYAVTTSAIEVRPLEFITEEEKADGENA